MSIFSKLAFKLYELGWIKRVRPLVVKEAIKIAGLKLESGKWRGQGTACALAMVDEALNKRDSRTYSLWFRSRSGDPYCAGFMSGFDGYPFSPSIIASSSSFAKEQSLGYKDGKAVRDNLIRT